MYKFNLKLKHLKLCLKKWNRETFGNIFNAQEDLYKAMGELRQEISSTGHIERTLEQEKVIHNQLEERRKQEEIYWKQMVKGGGT